MRYAIRVLAISLTLTFAGALAQDDDAATDAAAETPVATEACFSAREARSLSALTDQFVYLEARGDQHYLLTMRGQCPGLQGARGVALRQRTQDRVCANDLADITYRPFGSSPPLSCVITVIEAVADKDAAESLAEQRSE